MNIRASGRAALILAAALAMCIAGPLRATESEARTSETTERAATAPDRPVVLHKFVKRRHFRKFTSKTRKSAKFAAKARKAVEATPPDEKDIEAPMPASVANANAQLAPADGPAETAQTMAAKADDVLKMTGRTDGEPPVQTDATLQLVAADQLNDVDRAIDETAVVPDMATARINTPTISTPTTSAQVAASTDSTALDQTSLIGKIFIAFGGLLTLASAARMFIA